MQRIHLEIGRSFVVCIEGSSIFWKCQSGLFEEFVACVKKNSRNKVTESGTFVSIAWKNLHGKSVNKPANINSSFIIFAFISFLASTNRELSAGLACVLRAVFELAPLHQLVVCYLRERRLPPILTSSVYFGVFVWIRPRNINFLSRRRKKQADQFNKSLDDY